MKKLTSILLCSISAMPVFASESLQLGIGYSSLSVLDSRSQIDYTDTVDSVHLAAKYVFNDNVAVSGMYRIASDSECETSFDTDCTDPAFEVSGIDINVLLGANLDNKRALYGYTGLGIYSETWDYNNGQVEDTFRGLQIPFGIGYNFGVVALEAEYLMRLTGDYENGLSNYFSDDISAGLFSARALVSF
ncbi:outer membrane beta-barrel protein [Marinomonas balearica]|uniref:Outer membrane protein with beta-barrel domain n=1 Tax=Marinomonas balearica TaxID=491947 RepID=A0A4R6MH13_9GAMM|nr:outer membrane beta-barrel protein [Marinomonas balearica]TDO99449.1 outer membrane protein with beta-barrel domain [Marinomonas balearica]